MNKIILYKDLDLTLSVSPINGDILPKENEDAIKRSLLNLISWGKWSIPFNSYLHSYIEESLFDPPTIITANEIESRLSWLIRNQEPRIELERINVYLTADESGYSVEIIYKILSLGTLDNLTTFFTRIR